MAISMIPLGFCIRFSLGLVFFFFLVFGLILSWVWDGFSMGLG